ncbi:hypothetical protein KVT40_007012 [Elsinoe batatas]|uniref:Fe2OG dioxygenase domain-containing protein n=1 Tax=Elsinoe batatas TaxID=2601811 RepID=A0A8K0PD41_9PEZI|nr:hypothetical protein KVT40_007012 [Elsinoe batatas]
MSNLDEAVFDPSIHLAYSPPKDVFSLADLGIEENRYTTPVAGCKPFKFLSKEGVLAYRRAILKRHVFDQCGGYPFPGTVTLRNVARVSPFVRDLWTHPQTLAIMSAILGTKVDVVMPTEIGHTNIQVTGDGDVLEQLSVEPTTAKYSPAGQEEEAYDPLSGSSVIPWHYDSYPYVCIIMLSDTTNMRGGETFISGQEIQAVEGPTLGTAVLLQGGKVKHLAARTFGSAERITTITSFRADVAGTWDDSYLANLRAYDNLPVLYQQWSRYRLTKMRDEIDLALTKIESAEVAEADFPRVELEDLCERLSEYARRTASQIVDPQIRDRLAAEYGSDGIARAGSMWQKVKSRSNTTAAITGATKYAEDTMPEMRKYILDWCQTRARLLRGSKESGTQGSIEYDATVEYLLGDELLRQGLVEILLHWMDTTELLSLLEE